MYRRKWAQRWTHHRNLLSRGHSEVSLFYGVIQMALIVWLTIRDSVSIDRQWVIVIIPAIFVVGAGIQYLVGYVMDQTGIIRDYQAWDAERNPLIVDILNRVRSSGEKGERSENAGDTR